MNLLEVLLIGGYNWSDDVTVDGMCHAFITGICDRNIKNRKDYCELVIIMEQIIVFLFII